MENLSEVRESGKIRRKHPLFIVIVTYTDGDVFTRKYTKIINAERFASRQEKSSVVASVQVSRLQ